MNVEPYEELKQYLLTRKEYAQVTLIQLTQFKQTLQHRCLLPRLITIAALDSNHLMCMTTLSQLESFVVDLCNRPHTADTNMATYDLYNRLMKWTEIYKLNVVDAITHELSFINGVIA